MNFLTFPKRFCRRFFGESSIHGFRYVVRGDLHFLENFFWTSILVLSSIATYYVFRGQYIRFKENPTVLSVELMPHGTFPKPSTTICPIYNRSHYVSEYEMSLNRPPNSTDEIIQKLIFATVRSNFSHLDLFREFEGVQGGKFDDFNLLDIANLSFPHLTESSVTKLRNFKRVVTEVGLCFSTNHLHGVQDLESSAEWEPKEVCVTSTLCLDVTSYKDPSAIVYRVYYHSPNEVLIGDSKNFDSLTPPPNKTEDESNTIVKISHLRRLKYEQIKAEPNVRLVPRRGRRCLFIDERQDEFFRNYTVNLCKMSCRIRNAMEMCKCVPYFYNLKAHKFPMCNVSGMICLAKNNSWTNTSLFQPCKCPDMCENLIITTIERNLARDNFDTKVEYLIVQPRTIIKRGVLFDYIDLIVSLGGTLALFLGFSFISAIEIFFFVLEFLLEIFFAIVEFCIRRYNF